MIYLVMYDIASDKIRSKVAKRLTNEGFERIQLSIFSGIESPKNMPILWQDLRTWLKEEETSKLYVVGITNNNFRNMEAIGTFEWDMDYLLGTKASIFF